MADVAHHKLRVMAVVAVTFMSLACGSNYAYSAWGPQFADRMKLSATYSNLIGTCGNMGMYATGIPVGMFIDTKGPRPSMIFGSFCLGIGYFPIRYAYDHGAGSMSVFLLCLFSFLTGLGSCAAFSAAIKTAAINWPSHRGTATAMPLAAFGLSALFFSTLSSIAFPDNTSSFLLLLSIGTFALVFISQFFIYLPAPTATYASLPTDDDGLSRRRRDSNPMLRTRSIRSKSSRDDIPGEGELDFDRQSYGTYQSAAAKTCAVQQPQSSHAVEEVDEVSSLMSKTSSSVPGDIDVEQDMGSTNSNHSCHVDVTGLALLYKFEFWQLWVMLGLLTGVGLMTINNIGNDAQALWTSWDDSVTKEFIMRRQLMHVSIISAMSFAGRLLSGIGSDYLVKHLHMSRFWCLVASSCVFTLSQFAAIKIENPNFLWVVSGFSGLAYGALFGVFPALVTDAFGVNGLSLNWGYMILSSMAGAYLFNLCYGRIYDHHSTVLPNGDRTCSEGLKCYAGAYWITLVGSAMGIVISLLMIRHQKVLRRKRVEEEHRVA
ncbi:MFS general substrate transporter [Eremomyces bilateralis CBS 781.70]|uniref:MFS general substrate transporter n=1 Tax=Eremomyces bilateralis CBS 781.70 TaxID=1392243 RepID=A0A6G1G0Q5_9PEZI|nr:MFS general substrate transporter [Eremomyces bilateralis CBS 781.70]KAF1811511.1 MFS general substrate transporter [Eremomyces bilateralis CBS 781.70]